MSVPPIPPFPPATIKNIPGLVKANQTGFWTPVANNAWGTATRIASTTQLTQACRVEIVPQCDIQAIRLRFVNFYPNSSQSELPNTNPILVRASYQYQGATLNEAGTELTPPFTFGGKELGVVPRGGEIVTDPLFVNQLAGIRNFIKTWCSCELPSAPQAPSVATSAGTSNYNTATYGFCLTYVYPDGIESAASASTSLAVTATNNIVVQPPAAVPGALGYRVWQTNDNGSLTGAHYDSGSGLVLFGKTVSLRQRVNFAMLTTIEQVDPTGVLYMPAGGGVLGGTAAGASNNGEGSALTADAPLDYTREGHFLPTNKLQNVYSPISIEGLTPSGIGNAVAIIGDSISKARDDAGFGDDRGGYMVRALQGQIASNAYDPNVLPSFGHLWLGQAGETLQTFAGLQGSLRKRLAKNAPVIWSNYITNDINNATGVATCVSYLLSIAADFTGSGRIFIQNDMLPRLSSNDGFATLAGQFFTSAFIEGQRRQWNNWVSTTTGAIAVSNELPFRAFSGSVFPSAYDVYGPGDAAITTFYPAFPIQQLTETVTVAGVTKTRGVDYNYGLTQTINGVAYASSIVFTSPPASLAVVQISYTKMASWPVLGGPLVRYMPCAIAIEVNTAGTAQLNGGLGVLAGASVLGPRSVTAVGATSVTDSTQAWTQDQYRGMCVYIVSDAVTPAAAGQIRCIAANSATVLNMTSGWTTLPSSSAIYRILPSAPLTDFIHIPTSAHIAIATRIVNNNLALLRV